MSPTFTLPWSCRRRIRITYGNRLLVWQGFAVRQGQPDPGAERAGGGAWPQGLRPGGESQGEGRGHRCQVSLRPSSCI